MISSTVVPLGSDLSRAPSCARAIWDNMMIGNRTLDSAARERSKGNVNRAGRDWNLINPILTKREHRKANGSLHPQSRRAYGPSEGVEDRSSAYFIGCFGRLQVRRIYFSLPSREFRIALAIPHSTNPGNNWYSLMTGIMVQGTTTSRFLWRYARQAACATRSAVTP